MLGLKVAQERPWGNQNQQGSLGSMNVLTTFHGIPYISKYAGLELNIEWIDRPKCPSLEKIGT